MKPNTGAKEASTDYYSEQARLSWQMRVVLRKWYNKICPFLNIGISQPLFGTFFFLYWFIVRLQLIHFTIVNGDWKQERSRKRMHHWFTCYRKSSTHCRNRLTALLNLKKPKSVPDSNWACPDRMTSLCHLCHNHFQQKYVLSYGKPLCALSFFSAQYVSA